jgi:two-component system, NarL family, nitrate/nitrite response regulator NarL
MKRLLSRKHTAESITQHNEGMSIRVLVVDDDDFSRTTIAAAIADSQITVIDAVDGVAAAMRTDLRHVDVAVLDLDLGEGPNGVDLAHALRRFNPDMGIVLLTSFSDPRLFSASVKELPESSVYVVKQSMKDIRILTTAIRGSVGGFNSESDPSTPRVPLSDTQIETLRLLAYGLSNSEIARVRVVTEKSVEQAIKRAASALAIDPSPNSNQRVELARAFFALTGATRHRHLHR